MCFFVCFLFFWGVVDVCCPMLYVFLWEITGLTVFFERPIACIFVVRHTQNMVPLWGF